MFQDEILILEISTTIGREFLKYVSDRQYFLWLYENMFITISCREVSTLDHKVLNDSMECGSLVTISIFACS
jgi:hypothetical protein